MSEKANFIEVRLNDGKILRAEGAHAAEVWSWINSCETMAFVHGCKFSGKPMETVEHGVTARRGRTRW